jgi:membrane-bound lytic murein transglycosylase D
VRPFRAGCSVALALILLGAAPLHAQQAHEATLVVSADSDPYPVSLAVNEGDRAIMRGDSRLLPAPAGEVPGPFEAQRAEMDLEACRAFFGEDATCTSEAVPPADLFAGVRVPRAFTTAAVSSPEDAPTGDASAEEGEGGGEPASEASGGERDLTWLQGLVLPDLPVHWTDRLIWFLQEFREGGSYHNAVEAWIRRSGRWAEMARAVFRRHGIPEDLLWVAAIESSFGPTERSSAGAVGLWQFMPEGGRDYGLRQNRWIDERRNPEMSTEAVALYFYDLYARFGSWDLALAGFNMGYAGLERAMLKNGTNDYWTLARTENALPYGTTTYVPKAVAVAIVSRNLERFGLAELQLDPPRAYDLVEVRGVTRITALASAARISMEEFKTLNPELLRDRTPPGESVWLVRVPAGAEEGFVQRLAAAREEDQTRTYTVRFGETVTDVAERFRTSTARVRRQNGLGERDQVRGGDVLEVPDVEPRDLPAATPVPNVVVPAETFVYPERRRLFYRTIAGDTLEAVAGFFGVTPTDLVTWNVLDPEANLIPGLIVQLFAPPDFDPSTALVLGEDDVAVYVAGSAALFEQLARQDGRERVVYMVREGDTIETIAQRFGTTKTSLVRVNRFGFEPDLAVGDEVIVYATPEEAERYRRESGASTSPPSTPPPPPPPPPAENGPVAEDAVPETPAGAADGGAAAAVVPSASEP